MKLTESYYRFCLRLFRTYKQQTGQAVDERLRKWLYTGATKYLVNADYLVMVSVFDYCVKTNGENCDACLDKQKCQEIFEMICERASYSSMKISETAGKSGPLIYSVSSPAKEKLKMMKDWL